jgi:flagellar motor switch protein FliN/FliY
MELAATNDVETEAGSSNESSLALQRVLDLKLPVAVVLGQAVWPIQEILKLTSGSLIELDRTVNDDVDLVIHGTVVARGQIVSVKGNYGVRIKRILSPENRLAMPGTTAPNAPLFDE